MKEYQQDKMKSKNFARLFFFIIENICVNFFLNEGENRHLDRMDAQLVPIEIQTTRIC